MGGAPLPLDAGRGGDARALDPDRRPQESDLARAGHPRLRARDGERVSEMVHIDDDMRAIVGRSGLGYAATVTADGKPNLSPKGSLAVWDDDHRSEERRGGQECR